MKRALICFLVALLAACAAPVTKEEIETANVGPVPTEYEKPIQQYFESHLKDPFTAQYQPISKPEKGVVTAAPIAGGGKTFGWLVSVNVNAKNIYGAYVGWKTYSFLFRGNEIIHVVTPPDE